MGRYNFEKAPCRVGHHTYKWKEVEKDKEVLPAWIADMDFEVLPEIQQAVHDYANQLNHKNDALPPECLRESGSSDR